MSANAGHPVGVEGAAQLAASGDLKAPSSRNPVVARRRWRVLRQRFALSGLVASLVFFAGSVTPSLLPRPWYLQGFVSGVAIAVGYGVGAALAFLGRLLLEGRLPPSPARWVRRAALLAASVLLLGTVILHHRWQVDIRRLMDMEPGATLYLLAAIPTAVAAGYLMVVSARLAWSGMRAYLRLLRGWMSARASVIVGLLSVLVLTVAGFDVLIADRLASTLDAAYLASDRRFDADVDRPESSLLAGGSGSLIEWETMGRQGRAFVTQAPDRTELDRFAGQSGLEPIRIYVGLQSAGSARERAELAMAELDRTGAFQREILLLIAPTGTGWIDPFAVEPLEYMYNGDTAAVALQYSHLPSWVLMIGNQDLAIQASRALFEAVRDHLDRLPETSRPRLLLYGESLGSFGWESLFDDVEEIERAADGVLWVGPPRANRLWQALMSERQAGSPLWRPVVGDGETVRFGPDGETLTAVEGPWHRPRIVYLQHPSDPITWLSLDLLFERPEWMNEPRGPDVSQEMPYVPVVTFWQLVVDLVMGTNAPLGHGHKFGPAQAEAWSLIVPPDGWSGGDTERLLATVAEDI